MKTKRNNCSKVESARKSSAKSNAKGSAKAGNAKGSAKAGNAKGSAKAAQKQRKTCPNNCYLKTKRQRKSNASFPA
jgi:hypothetical protein